MKKIFIAMALCFSLSANAQVFKCVDSEGKTVYQNNKPCSDDKGHFIDLGKNTNIPIEEYKKDEARIKQELEASEKRRNQQQSDSYSPYYSGGRAIHTGPRGGRYYYNSSGNKTYVRKK